MIDFIDPTLKTSARGQKTQNATTLKFVVSAIIVLILAVLGWFVFVFVNTQIDTKPATPIQIDPKFNNIEIKGRLPAIPKTLGSTTPAAR